jgi:hypothetical protein
MPDRRKCHPNIERIPAVMDGRWKGRCGVAESPRRIVLELEGILYDDSAWERWLFQLLGRVGLRTTFCRFRAVWRRDYFSGVTNGEVCPENALRNFLKEVGVRQGTIHEVCAAALCRQQRDIERPVLIPGAALGVRKLTSLGVSLAAGHQGNRSTSQWSLTLKRWRLAPQFERILAWPESELRDANEIPAELQSFASGGVWYISCDRSRCQAALDFGMFAVAYGMDAFGAHAFEADAFGAHREQLSREQRVTQVDNLADLQALVAAAQQFCAPAANGRGQAAA